VFLAALLFAAVAGIVAYNAGFSSGLAQTAIAQGGTAPYPYPYGWHRPWGVGFPLLFFVFWILLFRGFWWGGPWRRGWYMDGRHEYYRGPFVSPGGASTESPSAFDEWHRQAHERMKGTPPADDPGRG
jgi:ABC-type Fe3+ transport system permease subunit